MGFRRLSTRSCPSWGSNCPGLDPHSVAPARADELERLDPRPRAWPQQTLRPGQQGEPRWHGQPPCRLPKRLAAWGWARAAATGRTAGRRTEGRVAGVRLVTGRSIDISRGPGALGARRPGGPGPGARGGGRGAGGCPGRAGSMSPLTASWSGFASLWPLKR